MRSEKTELDGRIFVPEPASRASMDPGFDITLHHKYPNATNKGRIYPVIGLHEGHCSGCNYQFKTDHFLSHPGMVMTGPYFHLRQKTETIQKNELTF